jgi:hypothetical protein
MIISYHRLFMASVFSCSVVLAPSTAWAQQTVQPRDLGVVQAPTAGSTPIPLNQLPAAIKHCAEVAMKRYEGLATLVSAQLDRDDVMAIYEVAGKTHDGRLVEADIRPDCTVEELEVEIDRNQVPDHVKEALERFAPNFSPSNERPRVEKSIRPSALGLDEIWYEFGGTTFDVEVRSDGRALLIEPA